VAIALGVRPMDLLNEKLKVGRADNLT